MSVTISGDTGLAGAATGALNGSLGATTPSTVVATNYSTDNGGTATRSLSLTNTGGTYYFGVDGAVPTIGGTAYSLVTYAPSTRSIVNYIGGTGAVTTVSATGLSVTGLISATTTGKVGTTLGVGAATPSASGAGITFPATQSASTDANTLDDYEEGTWTPNQGSGLTVTNRPIFV